MRRRCSCGACLPESPLRLFEVDVPVLYLPRFECVEVQDFKPRRFISVGKSLYRPSHHSRVFGSDCSVNLRSRCLPSLVGCSNTTTVKSKICLSASCVRPCWSFAIRRDVMSLSWNFTCSHRPYRRSLIPGCPRLPKPTSTRHPRPSRWLKGRRINEENITHNGKSVGQARTILNADKVCWAPFPKLTWTVPDWPGKKVDTLDRELRFAS